MLYSVFKSGKSTNTGLPTQARKYRRSFKVLTLKLEKVWTFHDISKSKNAVIMNVALVLG
jgi:hypothetical protein